MWKRQSEHDINAASARRKAARTWLRGGPTLHVAARDLDRQGTAAGRSFFEGHAARLERKRRDGDHAGLHKHMKGLDVEVRRPMVTQNIKGEDDNLL